VTNWFYSQRDYIFSALEGDQIVAESSDDEDDGDREEEELPLFMPNVRHIIVVTVTRL